MTDNVEPVVETPESPSGAPEATPLEAIVPAAEANKTPVESPKPAKPQEMPKWGWERLHEETAKRQAETTARAAAEQKAKDLEEMLSRMQKGQQQQPEPATPRVQNPAEFDMAVQRKAAEMSMANSIEEIIRNGQAEFGAAVFDDKSRALVSLNCGSPEFLSDVMAVEGRNAHKLLVKIADDPPRAVALAAMSSKSRIAELTRMAMSEKVDSPTVPVPSTVSKAPAPQPKIAPTQASLGDPNDLMDENISDDEFFKRWKAKNKVA